jgi:hypothetical protein
MLTAHLARSERFAHSAKLFRSTPRGRDHSIALDDGNAALSIGMHLRLAGDCGG